MKNTEEKGINIIGPNGIEGYVTSAELNNFHFVTPAARASYYTELKRLLGELTFVTKASDLDEDELNKLFFELGVNLIDDSDEEAIVKAKFADSPVKKSK